MDLEPLFAGRDLELIEALVYDPDLAPSFDMMRDSLYWRDEYPNGITPSGMSNLIDLVVARSFLYHGHDFSEIELSPDPYLLSWERAQKQGLRWPGFKRLNLSETDKAYYEQMLKKSDEMEDY